MIQANFTVEWVDYVYAGDFYEEGSDAEEEALERREQGESFSDEEIAEEGSESLTLEYSSMEDLLKDLEENSQWVEKFAGVFPLGELSFSFSADDGVTFMAHDYDLFNENYCHVKVEVLEK